MFLACFAQKLSKKNLWGVGSTPLPLGKGTERNYHTPANIEGAEHFEKGRK